MALKKLKAFTLAEILLVISIIGIIAAMTIPSLINDTNKTELVVALKKADYVLNQAYIKLVVENGSIENALTNVSSHSDLANVFIPQLNVSKVCMDPSAGDTGCWPNQVYTSIKSGSNFNNFNTLSYSSITTADGITYGFKLDSNTCSTGTIKSCGTVYIDVNGPNKGPTSLGRDLFILLITKDGIKPRGAPGDLVYACDPNYGLIPALVAAGGCAKRVIYEGAMNY
jgi:prepilin-type N-terminal cleavage/methylation domain-containing protein